MVSTVRQGANNVMIYGNIYRQYGIAGVHPIIKKAIEFAAKEDFSALDFGVHTPSENFLVQVIDMVTSEVKDTRAEIHRNVIDLHLSLEGEETVYYRPHADGLIIGEDLFAERDIGFFNKVDNEIKIPLGAGDFIIFFPGEVHRPGCVKENSAGIKKVVLKIDSSKLS